MNNDYGRRVSPGVKPFLVESGEVENKKRGQLDNVDLFRVGSRPLALLTGELVNPLSMEEP